MLLQGVDTIVPSVLSDFRTVDETAVYVVRNVYVIVVSAVNIDVLGVCSIVYNFDSEGCSLFIEVVSVSVVVVAVVVACAVL